MSALLVEAVLLIVAPHRADLAPSASEILHAAASAIEPRTTLKLRLAEAAGVDTSLIAECPIAERVSCWARAAINDRTRVLLVVGVHPISAAELRLYALMLDLEQAARVMRDVPREREDWREEIERRIFAEALKTEPEVVPSERLMHYFEQLVDRFRPVLERDGFWRKETPASAPIVPVVTEKRTVLYDVTLWGGLGVALAGGVVAIASAALARERQGCLLRDASAECSFERDAFSAPALGIGFLAAGAGWSAGTVLTAEPEDVPWIAWSVGTVLGALGYVVSWLLIR